MTVHARQEGSEGGRAGQQELSVSGRTFTATKREPQRLLHRGWRL